MLTFPLIANPILITLVIILSIVSRVPDCYTQIRPVNKVTQNTSDYHNLKASLYTRNPHSQHRFHHIPPHRGDHLSARVEL